MREHIFSGCFILSCVDSKTGLSNSPRCKEDYPVMDRDSSSRDQACVPVKTAVKNAHDREARQSSDIKGKVKSKLAGNPRIFLLKH